MPEKLYEMLSKEYDSLPKRVSCAPIIENHKPIIRIDFYFPVQKNVSGLRFKDLIYAAREQGCFDVSFFTMGDTMVFNEYPFCANTIALKRLKNHKFDAQSLSMEFASPLDKEVRQQYINFIRKVDDKYVSGNLMIPLTGIVDVAGYLRENRAA